MAEHNLNKNDDILNDNTNIKSDDNSRVKNIVKAYNTKKRTVAESWLVDIKDVFMDIIINKFIPMAKDTTLDTVHMLLEKALFPDNSGSYHGRYSKRSNNPSYISYSSIYNRDNRESYPRFTRPVSKNGSYNVDDIYFEERIEAEDVLDQLNDILTEYGAARVWDLYEIIGRDKKTMTQMEQVWGWYDLSSARIENRYRDGFLLSMPKPERIN